MYIVHRGNVVWKSFICILMIYFVLLTMEVSQLSPLQSIRLFLRRNQSRKTILVDETHHLMYCYIPKNACTKFKLLFDAIATGKRRGSGASSAHIHNADAFRGNESVIRLANDDILQNLKKLDSKWRMMVVLRDPAERLLSGYLNKCVNGYSLSTSKGIVEKWKERYGDLCNQDFEVFVDGIVGKFENEEVIDYHFMPQHTFCKLDDIYPKRVSDTLIYHKDTIGHDTLQWPRKYDLEEYYSGWGKEGNLQLFDQPILHISSNRSGHTDDCEFYNEYYDATLLQKVQAALRKDYDLFQFPDPPWKSCLNGSIHR